MSYPALNNITAPDQYTAGAQIIGPGAVRFNLKIANQAIYVNLGDAKARNRRRLARRGVLHARLLQPRPQG